MSDKSSFFGFTIVFLVIFVIDMWKTHPEIEEILQIQAKTKSEETRNQFEHVVVSSDDENAVDDDTNETDGSSESGDDSDVDSEDDDSVEVVPSRNKFAALADDD